MFSLRHLFFLPFLSVLFFLPTGLVAQTATRTNYPPCQINLTGTMLPVVVTDCDQSGGEIVDWTVPTATNNEGCGPLSFVQTGGPTPKFEALIGEYEITYTFMAIDLSKVKIVNGEPDMASIKVVEQKSTFTLSVLPKDITPPTILPLAEQEVNANKAPDLSSKLTISDNCSPRSALKVTQSPVAGTEISAKTIIKIIVQDEAGNTADLSVSVTPK